MRPAKSIALDIADEWISVIAKFKYTESESLKSKLGVNSLRTKSIICYNVSNLKINHSNIV